jgi:hypothetical protein
LLDSISPTLALGVETSSCPGLVLPITNPMKGLDWHELDLQTLAAELRSNLPPAEAERMVWAFDQALAVARIDGDLLRYLLAATASLLARVEESSPRTVFEDFFRRSVSDDEWRERYAGLIA